MRTSGLRRGTHVVLPGGRVAALGGAVLLAASVMVLQPAGPAMAVGSLTDCSSTTYTYAGATEECTVPAGVTRIGVVAVGGQGGETTDKVVGGLGGVTRATIEVTPGQVLQISVGGYGGEHGGFGGVSGGDHGDAPYLYAFSGAGGGGSSDVRDWRQTALVVAGGGGGAGGGTQLTFSRGSGGQGGIGGVLFGPDEAFAAPGADGAGYGDAGGKGGCGGCVVEAGKGDASTFGDGAGGAGGGGGGYPRSGAGGLAGGDEGSDDVGSGGKAGGGGGGGGGMSFAIPTADDVSYGVASTTGDGSITLTMSPTVSVAAKGPSATAQPVGDTTVFDTPGDAHWQVPDSVTAVKVTATGAAGGTDDHAPGAPGDEVTAMFRVEPGAMVDVIVGARGGGSGGGPGHGYTPGGDNGSTCGDCYGDDGAGGGGSTSVATGDRLQLVAGGGGGGGGDADGGTDGAAGGAGGLSPQPGFSSIDYDGRSRYGTGGGGGNHSTGPGGGGEDCHNAMFGAGGGGGGGYFLPHMGGGGDGGSNGACGAYDPDPPVTDTPTPGAPDPGDHSGEGGGGAGGGGGRSYIDPDARGVVLGGSQAQPGNGRVTITPVGGGVLTVGAGSNLTIYPHTLLGFVDLRATDIFGDPIPNLPVTLTAPPNTLNFGTNDPACQVKENPVCTLVTGEDGLIWTDPAAVALPWALGPFVITATSPGFAPVEVTGLIAAAWPTTTTLTSSTPTWQSSPGDSVVFRAQVTSTGTVPSTSPFQLQTGSVLFAVDGVAIPGGPVPLDASATAVSPPVRDLALGDHYISATYTGDSANQAFQTSEADGNQLVRAVGSSVALTSSSNPVTPDGSVIFSATVTSTTPDVTPTGTVQFSIDGTAVGDSIPLPAVGPFTVSSESRQLPDPLLAPGTHEITATYSGDNTVDSSLATLTQTVTAPAPMSLQACFVRANAVPDCEGAAVLGMSLLAGFDVDGPAPTGTVQFLVDGAPFGDPVPLVTGNTNISTAASAALAQTPGLVAFEARYSGDARYAPTTSALDGPLYQYRSMVKVSSSVPTILPFGKPTTFTATVEGTAGPVTIGGTVRFYNTNVNRAFSGDLPVIAQKAVLADQGSCQIGSGQVGVRVDYSGDPGYALAPGSGTMTQYVLSTCLDEGTSPTPGTSPNPGTVEGDAGSGPVSPGALPGTGADSTAPTLVAAITLLVGVAFLLIDAGRRARRRRTSAQKDPGGVSPRS